MFRCRSSWVGGSDAVHPTILVPRTRSSRSAGGKSVRELRVQRGTRIMELLVVLGFRSSSPNVPRVLTNFGIGPLVPIVALGLAISCERAVSQALPYLLNPQPRGAWAYVG